MNKIKYYQPIKIEKKWINTMYNINKKNFLLKKKSPIFSMQLPPPNITGNLHIGHALSQTIMDILNRYHKMLGYDTLWIPGSDHAGIATQIIMEKKLKKINKNLYNPFTIFNKINFWKKTSIIKIKKQMYRLGLFINWDKYYFTLNSKFSIYVKKVFIKMYKDKLIYKGKKIVNWDPNLKTVISDLEVNFKNINTYVWYLKYPFLENKNKYIIVATTRPETLLADTAIGINKYNKKYSHLIGKKIKLPLIKRIIPIISDKDVKLNFLTNFMKITPCHSFIDYEIAKRHNLKKINIFDFSCKTKNVPKKFLGIDRFLVRKIIIKELQKLNLIKSIKNYKTKLPISNRSNTILEPLLTKQWFLNVNKNNKSLSNNLLKIILNKKIKIIPEKWENIYYNWIKEIKDWCISRQLWWGHKIPIWYDNKNNIYTENLRSKKLSRDNNVLDTWFSSSLIPFASLNYSNINNNIYLPSTILITGFDIIFFWVIRMIMLTIYLKKKIPFKKIYIHGLINDSKGKKMSKSKNNTINTINFINYNISKISFKNKSRYNNKIGVDTLRFTLLNLAISNKNIKFDINKSIIYKNFCNKLWNIAKFIFNNISLKYFYINNKFYINNIINNPELIFNKWIILKLQKNIFEIKKSLNNLNFNNASNIIYKFILNEFCNWYIEIIKVIFYKKNEKKSIKYETCNIIFYIFSTILKILHPIIPFISKELSYELNFLSKFIFKFSIFNFKIFPLIYNKNNKNFYKINEKINKIKNIVESCRKLKKELKIVENNINIVIIIKKNFKKESDFIKKYVNYIKFLTNIKNIIFKNNFTSNYTILKIKNTNYKITLYNNKYFNKNLIKSEIKKFNINKRKIFEILLILLKKNFYKKAPINIFKNKINNLNKFIEEKKHLQKKILNFIIN